jgi:hypothetical protein
VSSAFKTNPFIGHQMDVLSNGMYYKWETSPNGGEDWKIFLIVIVKKSTLKKCVKGPEREFK